MSENIDATNINTSSTFNLTYTNIDLDGEIPLCLADDKESASKAISLVIGGTRRGFVSLCADVASLLRAKKKLELKVDRLKKEVAFLRGSPDLASTSHLSQLSLSDRDSLSESLQLRIIGHVLQEHVDDVKSDKASLSKPISDEENAKHQTNSGNPQPDVFLSHSLPHRSPSTKEKPVNPQIKKSNSTVEKKDLRSKAEESNVLRLEERLEKALDENNRFAREMEVMRLHVLQLQQQLSGVKDSKQLVQKTSEKPLDNNICIVKIEHEELEMESISPTAVGETNKHSTSGLNSHNSIISSKSSFVTAASSKSSFVTPASSKPRALHRSKALPRIVNKIL